MNTNSNSAPNTSEELQTSLLRRVSAIVKDLNPQQREAVEHPAGPSLIIAGAGTGKTRTITSKIARLVLSGTPAYRILAVTFTNKAAREMKERVEKMVPGFGMKVWIHTFHSFCVRVLRQHATKLKLRPDFLIYDESDQKKIIHTILTEMGEEKEKKKAGIYINAISRAKDDLLDAESYSIHANVSGANYRIPISQVYIKYQKKLADAGALDFGDLLVKTVELLKNHDDVREYYQDFFRFILVDEYQDTNHAQYVLTKTLAAKRRNICVVGDPDQSIYSWRGANIRNILEFEKDFPDAKVIPLEHNYRSTPNILNAADKVIKNNTKRKPKNLLATKSSGDPVHAEELPSEGEEAKWVSSKIKQLVDQGYSLNDIAIFYRTNAQSRSFEDVFRRYQIPYRLIGAVRFYDRKEVKDALAYARILVNPNDNVSMQRIINVPTRGIGKTAQDRVYNFSIEHGLSYFDAVKKNYDVENLTSTARRGLSELSKLLENLTREAQINPPALVLQRALLMSGYWNSIENDLEKDPMAGAKLNNLQELINATKEYEERCEKQNEKPTLSGFLQEISLVTSIDSPESGPEGVTLMTVHLAKGLEFPVVFLTGLEEGLFPIESGSTSDDEMEEERRLCYVGMTRAKSLLFMTCATTRRMFGKVYANMVSRFMFESGVMQEAEVMREVPKVSQPQRQYSPKAYRNPNNLTGKKVRHAVYGEGKIIGQSGTGEKKKITVIFNRGGMHTFLLQYAPLEML
jgi:ATP-dependent DNA helicase UvrD/PcrA